MDPDLQQLIKAKAQQLELTFRSMSDDDPEVKPNVHQIIEKFAEELGANLDGFYEHYQSLDVSVLSFESLYDAMLAWSSTKTVIKNTTQTPFSEEPIKQIDTQECNKGIEEQLTTNLESYEQFLQRSTNEKEKQIIRNLIVSTVAQLDNVQKKEQGQSPFPEQNNSKINSGEVAIKSKQIHKKRTKDQLREVNLKEIFTFYCRQQYVSSIGYDFERLKREVEEMTIGMFYIFLKQFGIIKHQIRKTTEQSQLHIRTNETSNHSVGPMKSPKYIERNIQDSSLVQQVINLERKEKYPELKSKYQWWEDSNQYEKYYNPKYILEESFGTNSEMTKLSRKQIIELFKQSTYGHDMTFTEFKLILPKIAQLVFKKNVEATEKLLVECLMIDFPLKYRLKLIKVQAPFYVNDRNDPEESINYLQPIGKTVSQQKHQKSEDRHQLKFLEQRLQEQQSLVSIKKVDTSKLLNDSLMQAKAKAQHQVYNRQQYHDLSKKKHLNTSGQEQHQISLANLINSSFTQLTRDQGFKPNDLLDSLMDDGTDSYYFQKCKLPQRDIRQQSPEIDNSYRLRHYGTRVNKGYQQPIPETDLRSKKLTGLMKIGISQNITNNRKEYSVERSPVRQLLLPHEMSSNGGSLITIQDLPKLQGSIHPYQPIGKYENTNLLGPILQRKKTQAKVPYLQEYMMK